MDKKNLLDKPEVQALFAAACLINSPEEARAFMLDLCSLREIDDFAQRLEVARLLDAGESYLKVQHDTGASSTTVSRVSKCLNGPEGGYRLVLERSGEAVSSD